MSPPTNKGKKIDTRRAAIKSERLRFIAGLLRKGVPVAEVYRVITAKYGVHDRTAAKYLRELGKYAQGYLDDKGAIEAEICAAVDRLKKRSQREDSVGNRADELLLNIYGNRSAKAMQLNLEAQKLRLQSAQEELTKERIRLTRFQAVKAEMEIARNTHAHEEFQNLLNQIADNGAVGFGDIVGMTTLLLRRELEAEHGPDVGRVTSFLNLLYRIAEANPPTELSNQHFLIPANLFDKTAPDLGDELMPR